MQHAGEADGPQREEALGALFEQYAPALRNYLRMRFGFDSHTADDLVQGFVVEKILRRNLIARAEQQRGRFRTFLLHAINDYVVDFFRSTHAKKRIPPARLASLEADTVSSADLVDPQVEPPGHDQFNRAFLRHLLAEAITNTREHCRQRGLRDVWSVLQGRIIGPALDGRPPRDYAELADELSLDSPEQAQNRLVSGKRIFRRELRRAISRYAATHDELEEEFALLTSILGQRTR